MPPRSIGPAAPAPRFTAGVKRSMLGYVNRIVVAEAVESAVTAALRDGDCDPSIYIDAATWVKRAYPPAAKFDRPTLEAVIRHPRVRPIIERIGRAAITIAEERRRIGDEAARPDADAPTTLGWRIWRWDDGILRSPQQGTPWPTAELRVEDWVDSAALRGVAGIHALRVPVDPTRARWPAKSCGVWVTTPNIQITGIVERFGRYVLGTEGWRAEWVFIRKLYAPSTEIGLALETMYPEVEVHYADR